MNQVVNTMLQSRQARLSVDNRLHDGTVNRANFTSVQQADDRAVFSRDNRWVDSRVLADDTERSPSRGIEPGSDAFREFLKKLIVQSRQGGVWLGGDIVLRVGGCAVLVTVPKAGKPIP